MLWLNPARSDGRSLSRESRPLHEPIHGGSEVNTGRIQHALIIRSSHAFAISFVTLSISFLRHQTRIDRYHGGRRRLVSKPAQPRYSQPQKVHRHLFCRHGSDIPVWPRLRPSRRLHGHARVPASFWLLRHENRQMGHRSHRAAADLVAHDNWHFYRLSAGWSV